MHSALSVDDAPPTIQRQAWRAAGAITALGLFVLVSAYWPTVKSALHLWSTSSAYNYGYLIAPISIYLIWTDRPTLQMMTPVRAWFGLVVVAGFGLAWLAADLMGINEGRHLTFVGMMQGVFLFALGWRVYRRMKFALLYLWLMVPTGAFLVEPLQHISLNGAVLLLKVFAIPFYTEGWTIEVPTGDFVVEPGCSGLNFVLASLALALLFGKMNYQHSWVLRLVSVVVAVSVAVIANVLRVFLIVAITEWSNRKIDIANDHLLYGWIFFGIIMFAVMWVGMRYARVSTPSPLRPEIMPVTGGVFSVLGAAAAMAFVIGAFSFFAATTERSASGGVVVVSLPTHLGAWELASEGATAWRPGFGPNDGAVQGTYTYAGRQVEVAIAYCTAQGRGCEAASAGNIPVDPESPIWKNAVSSMRTVTIGGQPSEIQETELLDGEGRLVASWYDSAGCLTAGRVAAKICAARVRLSGRVAPGAFVALSAPMGRDRETALADLDAVAAAWPASETLVRILPR